MAKLCVTYLIWLIFGLFGFHHFYLKRPKHGFIWFITFGGFIIGWLRDSFCIPRYNSQNEIGSPSKRSTFRLVGEFVMGLYFPVLYRLIFPEKYFSVDYLWISKLFLPLLVSYGILTVDGAGRQQVRSTWIIIMLSYLTSVIYMLKEEYIIYSVIATCALDSYFKWNRCRQQKKPTFIVYKSIIYIVFGVIINICWIVFITMEVEVTIDGKTKTIRSILTTEDLYRYVMQFWAIVMTTYNQHGIFGGIDYIWKNMWDPGHTGDAFKYLNLAPDSTTETIRRVCRQLSSKHHPDHYSEPSMKSFHTEEYTRIRLHCDNLLKSR